MTDFTIVRLKKQSLDKAYALIRTGYPGATEGSWLAHAEWLLDCGGGVLAASAPGGLLLGIAGYRVRPELRHGQVLQVELMVACELGAGTRVREALVGALDSIAQAAGCTTMLVTRPRSGDDEAESRKAVAWERLGLFGDAMTLSRTIR